MGRKEGKKGKVASHAWALPHKLLDPPLHKACT